ncbi:MAG: amino acid adenylation domain-containing protein [Acidobacteriota bacterium]|nr:amino acid adenylation domain-containing protein [Acidobacteriota bacterium]
MNGAGSFCDLLDLLCQRARDQGERSAYTFLSNRGRTEQTVSYQRLAATVAAVAARLADCRPGDRVLLIYPPGLDYIAAFLGALAARVVAVPLYPPRSNRHGERLRTVIADCEPALALATEKLQPLVDELIGGRDGAPRVVVAQDLFEASAVLSPPALKPEDPAFLQYTSGSTGDPKGVVVTHGSLMANQVAIGAAFRTSPDDIGVSWLPMYHDMGLIGTVLHALYRGFHTYLMAPVDFIRDPLLWLRLIHRTRATLCGGPNFAYALCAQKAAGQADADLDLSSWRLAFNGSEPVRAETLRTFAETFAPHGFNTDAFFPCYGMAEATLFISAGKPGQGALIRSFDKNALATDGKARASEGSELVGCGTAEARHVLGIIDPAEGTPVPDGTVGEIVFSGPSLAAGYYNRPELSERTFRHVIDGRTWMRTGDLGFLHEGTLFVTGRLKDLIIIRGRNHYPQDIEATAASSRPELSADHCIAFAVDVDGDERLAACAEVGRAHRKDLDAQTIMQAVREAVSEEHQVAVETVALIKPGGLPKTSSGKPRRAACRQALAEGTLPLLAVSQPRAAEPIATAPLQPQELRAMSPEDRKRKLIDALKDRAANAARIPRADLDEATHLSAAGLDSIEVMELQLALESELGAAPPAGRFLEGPSFEALAEELAQLLTEDFKETPPPPRPDPLPLSSAQERLFFMTRLAPDNPFYHIALALRLEGPLDRSALSDALHRLAESQEILRTRIHAEGGNTWQEPCPSEPAPLPIEQVADDADWRHRAQSLIHQTFPADKPLLRTCLYRLNGGEHILVLVLHHLIADGWSMGVLVKQLLDAYSGLPLPALAFRYADYAAADRRNPRAHEASRIWWRRKLAGLERIELLPPDLPRRAAPDYRGACVPIHFNPEMTMRLRRLAEHSGATLFTVLLAGFKVLLYRLSGMTDSVVGTFMANRERAEVRDLIGYFANTIPLRTDLGGVGLRGAPGFTTVLERVKQTVRDAFTHQAVPFEHMVEDLELPRETGRNPLLDIIFVLQQSPPTRQLDDGLIASPVLDLDWGTVRFDLETHLWEEAETISGLMVYATELYEAETIERLAALFQNLLAELIDAPDRGIDLPPLPQAEYGDAETTAMEANLLSRLPLIDALVLKREQETTAFVVPQRPITAFELENLAGERLTNGAPDGFVVVDRLPLLPDGRVNAHQLLRHPVMTRDRLKRWEQQLADLNGVETVSLSTAQEAKPPARLHRFDLAPPRTRTDAATAQLPQADRIDWSGPPALNHGDPLVIPPDAPQTLGEALQRTARRFPQKGITFVLEDGGTDFMTYPQLLLQAQRLLSGLRSQGLKPGDAAILVTADLKRHLPTFWACVLGGFRPVTVAVPNAFDADNSVVRKLVNTWNLLDRPVVLTAPEVMTPLREAAVLDDPRLIDTETLLGEPDTNHHQVEPDDILFFQLTSGSTGVPKCIQETHRGVLAHIHAARAFNGYSPDDVTLNWLPMDHVVPILTCHLKDTVLGNHQVEVPTSRVIADPLRWLDLLERFEVTHSWAPNFGFKLVAAELEQQPERRWDLSRVKFLMNAGEQVTEPAVADFVRALQPHGLRADAVQPAFGMAEVCTCMTWNNHNPPEAAFFHFSKASLSGKLHAAEAELNPAEVIAFADLGPPHPGVSIRIADAQNRALPEDTIGRLQIKGPVVTPGYFRNPEANADAFVGDGWFNTGDLGLMHNGRLAVTGREKEMIIIHGANHYCYEIEDIVGRCEDVKTGFAAACSLPDDLTGTEVPAIFFSPVNTARSDQIRTIRRIRTALVASVGITPAHVIPIPADRFPKTTSGKIQRTRLKKELLAGTFRETQRLLDLHEGNADTLPDWFGRVAWVAAVNRPRLKDPRRLLIVPDQHGLGAALQASHGDRARVLLPGEDPADVLTDFPADHLIHLSYYRGFNGALETRPDTGWDLIELFQALAGAERRTHLALTVVTAHGRSVDADDSITLANNLLSGLLKTMSREAPWLHIRHVDLPMASAETNLPHLLAELTDPSREPESAWRGGRRLVPRIMPAGLPKRPLAEKPSFVHGGRYLITGGLGGIGAEVAGFLLNRYEADLLLLGRSPLPGEQPSGDKAAERRFHRYQSLNRMKGRVTYASVDIRDPAALREALDRHDFRPDGILHLAAVLEPRPLLEETPETFRTAVGTRVLGALALARLPVSKDAVFVNFSSVNGFFGGAGVAAYAASCSYADGFTDWLAREGKHRAYGLAWSMWEQVGMSRGLPTEPAAALGFAPIDSRRGMLSFEAILLRQPDNLLIGLDRTRAHVAGSFSGIAPARETVLQAHYSAPQPLPTPFTDLILRDAFGAPIPGRWLYSQDRTTAEESPRPATASGLEKEIARIAGEVLGVTSPGIHQSFFELGGHSLLLTRFHARLTEELDLNLTMVDLFQYPTIAALAAFVEQRHKPATAVVTRMTPVSDDIAVIGMACRFPGADNPETFWENLRDGVESIRFFSKDELAWLGETAQQPGYVPANPVLEDIETFDAAFFQISPREAALMDPQQRVMLYLAWEALESAGYKPGDGHGPVGLFTGVGTNTYLYNNIAPQRPVSGNREHFQAMLANDKDFAATRVAYKLNLRGPAITLQTACSTSLVALHQACKSLRDGECDMALAGGVSVRVPQNIGYRYSEGLIFSPDGRCRAFDERAGGTIVGNGGGLVLLKPLEAARRDGDPILAVVKGSAVNNDGAMKVGYTAPSVEGQESVIRAAHRDADIQADSVTYVEAHGTGTPLGDPIEIAALTRAFNTGREGFCAVGSVKTNIGHLDTAAGVAGLIKTILAMQHRQLPPSLHFNKPNPNIDFAAGPFYVNNRLTDWEKGAHPRRAGISSFGIGGTNAHVVLEEAPQAAEVEANRVNLLTLSAKSPEALAALVQRFADRLRAPAGPPLSDLCHTSHVGRTTFDVRLAVAAADAPAMATALEKRKSTVKAEQAPEIVFLFTGQGAEYQGMGRELYREFPVFREAFDRCDQLLRMHLERPLESLLWGDNPGLEHTIYAQTGLFALQYALARTWESLGLRPTAVMGHSVGEYAAAVEAGILALEPALNLLAARARLMQCLPGDGSMIAVFAGLDHLTDILENEPEVTVAAFNGPTHTVLSGRREPVEAVHKQLTERGLHVAGLSTTRAFHAPLLDPMLDSFETEAHLPDYHAPKIPFISGLTGAVLDTAPDAVYWRRQTREPVRFEAGMRLLLEKENRLFVELGPHPVLCGLGRRLAGRRDIWLPSLHRDRDGAVALLESLGQAWSVGCAVNLESLTRDRPARRVPAPTYPFQGKRHWIEPQPLLTAQAAPGVTEMNADAPTPPDRASRILTGLHALMVEILKADPQDIGPDDSFMELGADSIVLVDATQAIEREYGVSLKIRQFFEDTTDLRSLAAWLNAQLPPEEAEAPPQPEPAPAIEAPQPASTIPPVQVAPVQPTSPPPAPTTTAVPVSDLAGLMQAQLETVSRTLNDVVRQQLAVLQGGVATPQTAATTPPKPAPPQPETKRPANAHVNLPVKPAEVAKTAGVRFKDRQQQHLDDLVTRFTQKTKGSKASVQQYRGVLADSRAAMGFRFSIKEMLYPIVGKHSQGSRILDVDGNEYVDVTMGQGVNFYGHNPAFVTEALQETLDNGIHLNPRSEHMGQVAEMICAMTGMDRLAMTNSGTEAVMTMMRLARAATGRNKIVIFEGSYHGHADHTLALPPNEPDALHALPVAAGTPPGAVEDVIVLDYGTDQSLEFIRRNAHRLAAVMAEPIQSRFPDRQPAEFLREVRKITADNGALLLFDEMLSGFRCHPGGAQAYFDIRADLATYGKIIGGGMPIGIVAGKAHIMDGIDGGSWQYGDRSFPAAERIFFGGTFCFHPMAMAAAHATLVQLQKDSPQIQEDLSRRTHQLVTRLNTFFVDYEIPAHIMHFGSLFRFSFKSNMDLLFYHLLDKGVYLWEGRNCFLSTAHDDEDIEFVARAVENAAIEMREGGFIAPCDRAPNLQPAVFPKRVFGGGEITLKRRPRKARTKPAGDARGFWQRHDTGAPLAGNQTRTLQLTANADRDVDFSLFYFGTYPSEAYDQKYDLLFKGARFADTHDFSAVWVPERHFHSFGGFSPNPSVVAAGLARETKNIEIRGGSVVLPLHNPIRVAEEWSVVDNLSGGRVAVAFASGWHPDDFVFAPEIYGEHRETMFREIDTVRALWRGQSVRVHNGDDKEISVNLHPLPLQKELRTWITVVNNGDTFERAGRIGAGVLTNLIGQSLENLAANIQRYRNALRESGFDPASGHVTVMLHTFVGKDLEVTREAARQPFYDYLQNCVGLFKKLAVSQGLDIDPDKLDADDREFIMGKAYDRYVATSALIGTPESCRPVVDNLLSLGVDEISCFIDFGVPVDIAVDHLPHLSRLRNLYKNRNREEAAPQTVAEPAGPPPVDEPRRYPVSTAQKQLLILSRMDPKASSAYIESVHINLKGRLDVEAMRRAAAEVVRRHDALRTGFDEDWEHQFVTPPGDFEVPVVDFETEPKVAAWLLKQQEAPFDLQEGSPIRVLILRRADDEFLLVLSTHHIVVDGWSLDLVLHEICTFYKHFVGEGDPPQTIPQPFSDHLARQTAQLASGDLEAQRRYWMQRFEDGIAEPALPLDFSRPDRPDFSGARLTYPLDPDLAERVPAAGRTQGLTPFMTLFGAFTLLLHKIIDSREMVTGISVAGRPMDDTRALVGYVSNLLPIRTVLDERDMAGFMKAARSVLLEAFDHQDYSFADLLQNLREESGDAGAVNVVFNMDKPVRLPDLAGVSAEILERETNHARFDLMLNVLDIDGKLVLEFDYRTGLFKGETIQRIAGWFEQLLRRFADAPDTRLDALSLLTENQRKDILDAWNLSGKATPDERCIHEAFTQQVAAHPNQIAVENAAGATLTYTQLDSASASLAAILAERGVEPETVVGLCLDDVPEAVTAMLAILRAGGAYLPLSPDWPRERIDNMLQDAGTALCITHRTDLAVDCLPPEAENAPAPVCRTNPHHTAYVIYTSGSTGEPKGVVVPHHAVMRLVYPDGFAKTQAGDRFAQLAQLSFDAATFEIWSALTNGGSVIAPERNILLEPTRLAEWFLDRDIHHAFLTSALFNNTAAEQPGAFFNLKTLLVGGEKLDPESIDTVLEMGPPQNLLNGYGPTENTTFTTTHFLEPDDGCPIGKPIHGSTAYVVDRNLQPVPPGIASELVSGGLGLASRYLQRPGLTAAAFIPNPFSDEPGARLYRTGDVVRAREDGTIEFLGRRDHQVKIRGFRIEPGEVEATLNRHPGIDAAAVVVGRRDGEHFLAAWLTPGSLNIDVVRDWLRTRLPEYMIPARFSVCDSLPLTRNGKLDRAKLLRELPKQAVAKHQTVAPRNRLEKELTEIWNEVLDQETVGVTTDFFDLGGHSLSATRVISRILETYSVEIPISEFFEQPTIAALARWITANGGTLQTEPDSADLVEIDL